MIGAIFVQCGCGIDSACIKSIARCYLEMECHHSLHVTWSKVGVGWGYGLGVGNKASLSAIILLEGIAEYPEQTHCLQCLIKPPHAATRSRCPCSISSN